MERLVLPANMHEIASNHTIGIHDKVIEGLLWWWGSWDGGDAIRLIANRDQTGIAFDLFLEAGFGLVPIEIQADGRRPKIIKALQRGAEEVVIEGPAVVLEVVFVDPNDGDWPWQVFGCLFVVLMPPADGQVIDQQVGRFHHR